MRLLKQTILHDDPQGRLGNCWQTAIACMMDLDLDEVPHFVQLDEEGGPHWYMHSYMWIWGKGWELKQHDKPVNRGYSLVSGKSPRGDFDHVVIYKNGKFFHDPHPIGTGLENVKDWETLRRRKR